MTTKICVCLYTVVTVVAGAVHSKQPRIAGGQDATKGQFPWLVSIQATNFVDGWHLCGGILLTPEWVLTAAHCLDSEKPEWLWVVSGEHDLNVAEGTEQHLLVDDFIQHPEYTYWERPYHNDVGLVHLSTPATLDEYTSMAPMLADSSQLTEGYCVEAGWGASQDGVTAPSILQWAPVPVLFPDYCEAAYPNFTPDSNILCVGDLNGGIGSCVGDNGGGLACWDSLSSLYLVSGVMSWREGCAQPGLPAVYMDTTKYKDWIISIISKSVHKKTQKTEGNSRPFISQ